MGYRFTLETANTVANLTFGRIMSCYREIYSSERNYEEFLGFLNHFHYNMYSDEKGNYMKRVERIRDMLFKHGCYNYRTNAIENDSESEFFHREVLDALKELSEVFERCGVKSLLLPKIQRRDSSNHDFMTSERTLHKLIRLHGGDSCLILQPQESPRNATIFNAFPHFDVALRQADMWPAVLFWEGADDYAFIPVRNENDLISLYEIVKYERHPINELKRIAETKNQKNHYIFQLSDLHFGAKNVDIAERRLMALLKNQLSKLQVGDNVNFVITGDAVDSPKQATENNYSCFEEYLEERCGEKPIRVLGNHDINNHGIAFSHGRQRISSAIGGFPKIKIIEESKTILLLFNSNTNGNLAEGEIGVAQMSEMGNLLTKVENIENYLLIAVLHHHLLPIPRPEYYEEKWYKRILPSSIMDVSLKLVDADLFLEWLWRRNVKIVLHGHKHIPFITKSNGITVIGCGSSTGQIVHKEKGKTYISYNILKLSEKTVTCTQFAEEIYGAGEQNIRTEIIKL